MSTSNASFSAASSNGELVFLFMYFVVIPLSAIGPVHFSIATYITGPIGHPLLVGLPIALCVRRFSR